MPEAVDAPIPPAVSPAYETYKPSDIVEVLVEDLLSDFERLKNPEGEPKRLFRTHLYQATEWWQPGEVIAEGTYKSLRRTQRCQLRTLRRLIKGANKAPGPDLALDSYVRGLHSRKATSLAPEPPILSVLERIDTNTTATASAHDVAPALARHLFAALLILENCRELFDEVVPSPYLFPSLKPDSPAKDVITIDDAQTLVVALGDFLGRTIKVAPTFGFSLILPGYRDSFDPEFHEVVDWVKSKMIPPGLISSMREPGLLFLNRVTVKAKVAVFRQPKGKDKRRRNKTAPTKARRRK